MEADVEVPATHQQLQDLIQREAQKSPTSSSSKKLPLCVKRRWERKSEGPHLQGRLTTTKRKYKMERKEEEARTQTRAAPWSAEPTIAPTTRATGQRSPMAETTATTIDSHINATTDRRTEHTAAATVLEKTPGEQDPVPEETMAKADNVPRVPHQGTGTQTLAEGAIDPLASGPRDCCSIWIHSRSKSVHEAQCLPLSVTNAHLVIL
jgi:hypothetical protein